MPKVTDLPKSLKAFRFHGVEFHWPGGDEHAVGTCPFCGREGKWTCNPDEGLWDCKHPACGTAGNPLSFLWQLWRRAVEDTPNAALVKLGAERGLLDPGVLCDWGVAVSPLTGEWLIPAWLPGNPDAEPHQLYRWARFVKNGRPGMRLMSTPGVWEEGKAHGVFHPQPLPDVEKVLMCEGPWDGIALHEVVDNAAVVAVPGAGVLPDAWLGWFAGKDVSLLYDADEAGVKGTQRAAGLLLGHAPPPRSVGYLDWGAELRVGFDVRDALRQAGDDPDARKEAAVGLLAAVKPVPAEWASHPGKRRNHDLTPLPCTSWPTVVNAWRKALRWRQDLEDVLAVMLAVCVSTELVGDQLFLQVIGAAGTGKTSFCDGLLVSKGCYPLEHLTGFHSGYTDGSGENFSLLDRIDRKTLITPEGDVLISSPHFQEIMSQQRRIFDGKSGASYKNRKEDMRWSGLRTPWIMAGTPALLDADNSRLGDRFLRVRIGEPDEDTRQDILTRVGYTAWNCMTVLSNGDPEGQVNEFQGKAYRLTGGYVDHLRAKADRLIAGVTADVEAVVETCKVYADLVADLRARPGRDRFDPQRHFEATKELPSRLQHQFVRLARCLAAVLGRGVDGEVLRVVRKVALDTCHGWPQDAVRFLHGRGPEQGAWVTEVAVRLGVTSERCGTMLRFLRDIGVAETFRREPRGSSGATPLPRWRLTERTAGLCDRVFGFVEKEN